MYTFIKANTWLKRSVLKQKWFMGLGIAVDEQSANIIVLGLRTLGRLQYYTPLMEDAPSANSDG